MGAEWFSWRDIEKVFIPNTVRVLGESAFGYCEKLHEIIFEPGSQLKIIGNECFYGCGLEEVVIPKSVQDIGNYAFYYCQRLRSLTFEEGSMLYRVGKDVIGSTQLDPKKMEFPSTVPENSYMGMLMWILANSNTV